jgi:spermidine synthase
LAPEASGRGASGAEVTLSELDGVRYLHFGTEWVQGAMQLAHPYRLELEYQQQMMAPLLFVPEPVDVLQLGLGAAALTKFCHRNLRSSRITAVELSPRVIRVARQWFALPPDDPRLRVVQADAGPLPARRQPPGAGHRRLAAGRLVRRSGARAGARRRWVLSGLPPRIARRRRGGL